MPPGDDPRPVRSCGGDMCAESVIYLGGTGDTRCMYHKTMAVEVFQVYCEDGLGRHFYRAG